MIAQILAHAKDVLVLDEATSALDSLNEAAIVDNVLSDRDRITLIVTHRLGRLRDVDRIYVLDDGRICESGRWDELLARRGALWRMHVETPPEPASAPLPL